MSQASSTSTEPDQGSGDLMPGVPLTQTGGAARDGREARPQPLCLLILIFRYKIIGTGFFPDLIGCGNFFPAQLELSIDSPHNTKVNLQLRLIFEASHDERR